MLMAGGGKKRVKNRCNFGKNAYSLSPRQQIPVAMLNIRLIGQCGISAGEEDLELPHSRKTRALLGYLVATDKSHRRDALSNMFWQNTDDPKGALRWSLSKLRPLLNEESCSRIDSDRQNVSFHPVNCTVDISLVRSHNKVDLQPLQTHRLIELNSLLRGEFLADLDLPDCNAYQFWLIAERARLLELRSEILKVLLARTDVPWEKLGFAQQLQALAPSDELKLIIRKLREDLQSRAGKLSWQQAKSKIVFAAFEQPGSSQALITELSTRLIGNNKFSLASILDMTTEDSPEKGAQQNGIRYLVKASDSESSRVSHITIQLVDTYEKLNLWGALYDIHREAERIGTLELISSNIASQVVMAELARVRKLPEEEKGGWELYLQALDYLIQVTEEDNRDSRRCAIAAIEKDPDIADAHAILAATYIYDALYGWNFEYDKAVELASLAAKAAVKVDPNDSSAVRSLGLTLLHRRDHSSAEKYFERACELSPYDPENIALLGYCHGLCGNFKKARVLLERALSMGLQDYFRATWFNHLALAAALASEFELGIDWSERSLSLNPRFPGAYRSMVVNYVELGKMDKAHEALGNLLQLLPGLTVAEVARRIPFGNERGKNAYLWALDKAGLPQS